VPRSQWPSPSASSLRRSPPRLSRPRAFRQGLRELVGVEQRNIVIEFRSAEGNPDKLPGLAAELVRLKADVIVVDTTVAIRAAMRGTSTIPIMMAIAADPVGSGFVPSLVRLTRQTPGEVPQARRVMTENGFYVIYAPRQRMPGFPGAFCYSRPMTRAESLHALRR
jgi:ABC transporter substrate binding protein